MVFCWSHASIFWFQPLLNKLGSNFLTNIESCILNNEWSGDFFTLQRQVWQGCPPSPYLFILSVEVLGKSIRANSRIQAVAVNKTEIKISQYADDTDLILNGKQESLSPTLNTINNFGYVTGLKLTDKKSEALWIRSNVGKNEKLLAEKNFQWPENKVKVLRVWISTDPTVTLTLNYTEKLEQIRNLLSCWEYRWLTLIGKIQVLKSLALSQLTYILTPLATNQQFTGEINHIFLQFSLEQEWQDQENPFHKQLWSLRT